MILFHDTETTGLPDFNARSADPNQPHIVQHAMLIYTPEGEEVSAEVHLVAPDGWIIPQDMTDIHGISHERALAEGKPEAWVTERFVHLQGRCSMRVAHNESFDRRIVRIAMTRAGYARDFIEIIEARAWFCTCKASTPILNLPPTEKIRAKGMNTPKQAGLGECIQHFFGEKLDGAHDALVDARACARIYFELVKRGKGTTP